APVAGSGCWPTWMARVSNCIPAIVRLAACPSPKRTRRRRARAPARAACARAASPHARLEVERLDAQRPLAPVGLQVGSADDPVAPQEGQHVVAVHALVLALVHLDQVPEAEDARDERPVPEQVLER